MATEATDSVDETEQPVVTCIVEQKKEKINLTKSHCFILILKYYYLLHEDVRVVDILKL